jgi:mannosylglycerate synthase
MQIQLLTSKKDIIIMSLVCFPFKVENPQNLIRNIKMAAGHPRVSVVLCVGVEEEDTFNAIKSAAPDIQLETGKRVEIILQDRIGKLRPGKGDGMNTALKYLLNESDCDRIHFYDADITSFGPDWITKAEAAADFGFGVVRHYFPRARTDAMITWMITRTGLALIWPKSGVSWIEQPLGGELLFKREVVEKLVKDKRVMNQSDWGIDTLYTFSTVQAGFRVYETYMQQGKAHSLYGKLTDLRTMLVECFSAIQSLKNEKLEDDLVHRAEPASEVPGLITQKIGFDFEGTLGLLKLDWTDKQEELLQHFPTKVKNHMLKNKTASNFSFMDEITWMDSYLVLLEHFKKGDSDWEELLFKLWILRVLNYTTTVALRGYDFSQRYLHEMVHRYRMKMGAEKILRNGK